MNEEETFMKATWQRHVIAESSQTIELGGYDVQLQH